MIKRLIIAALLTVGTDFMSQPTAEGNAELVQSAFAGGQLKSGEQSLEKALAAAPDDDQIRMGLGILQIIRSLERFEQFQYRHHFIQYLQHQRNEIQGFNGVHVYPFDGLREALACLDTFIETIQNRLSEADWNTRREILRNLINHIIVGRDQVRIEYRVNFPLFAKRANNQRFLQYCCRRLVASRGRRCAWVLLRVSSLWLRIV